MSSQQLASLRKNKQTKNYDCLVVNFWVCNLDKGDTGPKSLKDQPNNNDHELIDDDDADGDDDDDADDI